MPSLKLTFSVALESWELPEIARPHGPLFHRWIPNGRHDQVHLTAPDDANRLSVWFERRARVRGSFLEYAHDGMEFDEGIMARQGKLDAGVLRGQMIFGDVDDEELAEIAAKSVPVVSSNDPDLVSEAPLYMAAGKRLVGFFHSRVSRFIAVLKCQFGQYWLTDLRPWDSRRESLGSYCSGLNLVWWNECNDKGFRFIPSALIATMVAAPPPRRGFAEYLSEQDWRLLQRMNWESDVPTELTLLGRANQAIDQDDYRYAFIEAATALEMAVERRVSPSGEYKNVRAALQAFDQHPEKSRVAVVLKVAGWNETEIDAVLAALDVRNRIVHEGYQPQIKDVSALRAVLAQIARFMGLEEFKLPVLTGSNSLGPPGSPEIVIGSVLE